jgi:hypothetical protein
MKIVHMLPPIKMGENTLNGLSDFILKAYERKDEISGGVCLLQTKDKEGNTTTSYRTLGFSTTEEVVGLVEIFKMNYIFATTETDDEPDDAA